MDINKLLDDAKQAAGLTTDKDLSLHLGLSHGAVSNWRTRKALPDVVTCEKLAVLCGLSTLHVVASVNEMRAISSAEKKVWRRLAAALFVGMLVTLPAAAKSEIPTSGISQTMHYAKWQAHLRKVLSAVARSIVNLIRGESDDQAALLA